MDTEKIIQDLNRRFSAPLPEFYKRRIIFWFDEDREFEDKLDDIVIDGAKVISLTGSNNFYVKKLLNVDDTDSNYLVYSPISYESLEDNWLLDMQLYSEEFRADLISMWLDEPWKFGGADFVVILSLILELPDWISAMLLKRAHIQLDEDDRRHQALQHILRVQSCDGVKAANDYLKAKRLVPLSL